jgi:hypothetical protein
MNVRQTVLALLFAGVLGGCSSLPQAETPGRAEVKMTVVYANRDRINEVARDRGFTSQANGFYDTLRAELWCPDEETREAFSTCGHELRHVVKGSFHR